MKKFLLFIILVQFLSGCMYKSVTEGNADDIHKACIYDFRGVQYLVCLESVFQATSKKSGQGFTQISGFNDMRISVYDMTDGSLIARKGTGRQIDQAINFLGCSENNLWFFSLKEGIHSRDPKTLEVNITQDMILEKNPQLRDNLAMCEWYKINTFFQLNELKGVVVLTDSQGFRYEMDPATLIAVKMPGEYSMLSNRDDQPFETYISFSGMNLSLSGDLRKHINMQGTVTDSTLSFLDGKFIADQNILRTYQNLSNKLKTARETRDSLLLKIEEIKSLNNGSDPKWGTSEYDIFRKMRDSSDRLNYDLQNIERTLGEIKKNGYSSLYKQLLSPDNQKFFIFHRTSTAKDAGVIISLIELNNTGPKELWQTALPDLFYDPQAARETNSFKVVFSKGNPDFGFSKIDLSNDRLLIIWMLNAYCLDVNSGEILWNFRF